MLGLNTHRDIISWYPAYIYIFFVLKAYRHPRNATVFMRMHGVQVWQLLLNYRFATSGFFYCTFMLTLQGNMFIVARTLISTPLLI